MRFSSSLSYVSEILISPKFHAYVMGLEMDCNFCMLKHCINLAMNYFKNANQNMIMDTMLAGTT